MGIILDEHIAVTSVAVNACLGQQDIVYNILTGRISVLIAMDLIRREAVGVVGDFLCTVILDKQFT